LNISRVSSPVVSSRKSRLRKSELRGKGKFVNNVDHDSYEKEVGIPYSRALEIEEEIMG
jgi:hypothetical protein